MNTRIFKYLLEITDVQTIEIPRTAKALCADFQGQTLSLWIQLDTDQPVEKREVIIIGTDNPMSHVTNHMYVGTAQDPVTPCVWHVFVEHSERAGCNEDL